MTVSNSPPRGVTTLAGSADQITASASTGPVTLSLPSPLYAPGNLFANVITSLTGNIGAQGAANPSFYLTSTDLQQWQFGYNSGSAIAGFYDITHSRWAVYWANSNGQMTVPGNAVISGTVSASNLSGTNTGNQTITLTGVVTGSGTGSFATSFAASPAFTGTVTSAGDMKLGTTNGTDVQLEIGTGATSNKFAYVDFVGDTTYTDFGMRVGRDNGGANGSSIIRHRGTGTLMIEATDTGSIVFNTQSVLRGTITSAGALSWLGAGSFGGAFSASAGAVVSGGSGLQVFGGLDIQSPANFASSVKMTGLGNYANDAAAASGGVPVGGNYRNGSIVMVRVT